MAAKKGTSLYSASTEQNADSVESHPSRPGQFALGTYHVDKVVDEELERQLAARGENYSPPITRKGTLRLMQADWAADGRRIDVRTTDSTEMSAVLDMAWLHPNTSLLSVALADSTVAVYRATSSGQLERRSQSLLNDQKALCLSLDWSDRKGGYTGGYDLDDQATASSSVIVSQSDGTLTYVPNAVKAFESGSFADSQITWRAHTDEAWIAAFDCWSTGNVVWSGGDDLTLRGWDVRTISSGDRDEPSSSITQTPTFSYQRGLDGGVTCIQSHHLQQHLWAVGSYDEKLRLFDARQTRRPLSETTVGGGIWRIKWHPTERDTVLLGCMHDGFKVVQLNGWADENDFVEAAKADATIATRFDEHDSLAYGCDWDRGRALERPRQTATNEGQKETEGDVVFSCSFYDSLLHAWSTA